MAQAEESPTPNPARVPVSSSPADQAGTLTRDMYPGFACRCGGAPYGRATKAPAIDPLDIQAPRKRGHNHLLQERATRPRALVDG